MPICLYSALPRVATVLGFATGLWGCGSAMPAPADLMSAAEEPSLSVSREFRGVWIATVGNADWPSSRELTPAMQQAEARRLLDLAVRLHLNAVVLQVRPASDALYASSIDPWSEFLTAQAGQPPSPLYDPLTFWITEAHQRGIELHAWFNPYRASYASATTTSAMSITQRRPDLVRQLAQYKWLDPGEPDVTDYLTSVIGDVVDRYDVDGIHLDDYFYPYPEYNGGLDFPDDSSYKKYTTGGGTLARADWRRDNVNQLVHRLQRRVHDSKPTVKFGISPFGIWRPGSPPSVKGLDAYAELYADSKLWFSQGWVDYFSPQLYWSIASPGQSYNALLDWWGQQNAQHVHLWPGNYTSNFAPAEILAQIESTHKLGGATGNIHFSVSELLTNAQGIADALANGPYAQPALVPASPWLVSAPLTPPTVSVQRRLAASGGTSELALQIQSGTTPPARQFVIYYKDAAGWHYEVALSPSGAQQLDWVITEKPLITALAVSTIDRAGNESPRRLLKPEE